jgi:quercetin dioxygenase-like cupin family protein
MTDGFSVVDPDEVADDEFDTCETTVRKLTEPLGATELRANQVRVDPGEVTTPHTHEGQEEVFVAMTDGQIEIEGTVHDVSRGSVVRVEPETVRNLCNRTEGDTHVWLAFGAPPVGTVENFGSYVVREEKEDGGKMR